MQFYSYKSILTFFVIAGYVFFKGLYYKKWESHNIIKSDAIVYYSFLPAAFIYNDLSFQFYKTERLDQEAAFFFVENENGQVVQKTTVGVSILQLPFFLIAHTYSNLFNLRANGFTPVYQFMIFIAGYFYLMIGLFFLRKLLLEFFSDETIAIVLLIIAVGTNLFCYTVLEPGMSHVYSFCLISAFLYYQHKFQNKPTFSSSLICGLLLGFISLIRLPNILVIIVPVLWNLTSFNRLRSKISFLVGNFKMILLMGSMIILVLFIQSTYYKYVTGKWWYYAYGEEKFFFNNPQILQGLLGFRKGFFIYCPLMIFALAGIVISIKKKYSFALATLILFITHVYVIYSWWCWWYGGGLGARTMVDIYGVMALPIGVVIQQILTQKIIWRFITALSIVFFIALNLFQTYQYSYNLLAADGIKFTYYKNIWNTHLFYKNSQLDLTYPDTENALRGLPERDVFNIDVTNFLDLLSIDTVNIISKNGKFLYYDPSKNNQVFATSNNPWEWETLVRRKYAGDLYTFQASNNKFIGSPDTSGCVISANYNQNQPECVFKIIKTNKNSVILQSGKCRYWSVINDMSSLVGLDTNEFKKAERFTIQNK